MIIYSPARSEINKDHKGISDCSGANGVFKLLGCSILSINCTMGFNGSASSVSVTLVEDRDNGDVFIPPRVPSLLAISLPRGGVGAPVIYQQGDGFTPSAVNNTIPFYFAGICTNYSIALRDIGGRTISVDISDPREILNGVQCILSGFMLSQEVGAGSQPADNDTIYSLGGDPRIIDVENVIDVFGYWNYGLDSDKNEYGMTWAKIREPLENVKVTLYDIEFEFKFTGVTFDDVPEFYRINDQIIDIVSIVQKVAQDSGSDFNVIGRKTSSNKMLVEFKGIRRKNQNVLQRAEINNFVAARTNIVESVRIGREFRNEPSSSVLIGGMRNINYLALPSSYYEPLHLNLNGFEDYGRFESDIKIRLFGGSFSFFNTDGEEQAIEVPELSGAIFPFWGFTPDDHAYPLIEPVLPLDHLVFDKIDNIYAGVRGRIPLCKVSTKNFTVRQVEHQTAFIEGDEESDSRPFAYLEEYLISPAQLPNYFRGLPLNTEVLRASLAGEYAFYDIYSLYYPDIAENLGMPTIDYKALKSYVDSVVLFNLEPRLENVNIESFLFKPKNISSAISDLARDSNGNISKVAWDSYDDAIKKEGILSSFRTIIYNHVRQYALDHMGKKFIVCLPKSAIMQRIWNNLPVPTRPERPQIEYVIDDRGYWETVPNEFDGIVNFNYPTDLNGNIFTADEENQIRRKFMAEDGRFYPMAVIDWKPTGNVNFNSNGKNKVMFQDLPTSEFRPNRIATSNPNYVFVSCSVAQLAKRPDLALMDFPAQITFDPTVDSAIFKEYNSGLSDDEQIATIGGLMKYFWYHYTKSDEFQELFDAAFGSLPTEPVLKEYVNKVFRFWSNKLYKTKSLPFVHSMSTEILMDLKGVVIPLTSTIKTYGPWYYTDEDAKGNRDIKVDESLVPWNFERSDPWYDNLDEAGFDKLAQTLSDLEYVDTASIVVAGFPEFAIGDNLGYNSNITGISVDFSIGGVKTTYNLSTYSAKPGTFNKSEYDDVSRARIDTRERLPDIENNPIARDTFATNEVNRFPN